MQLWLEYLVFQFYCYIAVFIVHGCLWLFKFLETFLQVVLLSTDGILNARYTLINYVCNMSLEITLYLIQSTINTVEFLVHAIFQT